MSTTLDDLKIAAALVGDAPLAFRLMPDGAMVIIAPSGKKLRFSADAVIEKRVALQDAEKSGSKNAHTKTPVEGSISQVQKQTGPAEKASPKKPSASDGKAQNTAKKVGK